jgi:hypothetical protein
VSERAPAALDPRVRPWAAAVERALGPRGFLEGELQLDAGPSVPRRQVAGVLAAALEYAARMRRRIRELESRELRAWCRAEADEQQRFARFLAAELGLLAGRPWAAPRDAEGRDVELSEHFVLDIVSVLAGQAPTHTGSPTTSATTVSSPPASPGGTRARPAWSRAWDLIAVGLWPMRTARRQQR